jgi:hypothetical protein
VADPLRMDAVRAWGSESWNVQLEDHADATEGVGRAFVLAFDAPDVGVVVPNEYVAEYVADGARFIGFASVDPKRKGAARLLDRALTELKLRGLKLGPIYQHFHPHSKESLDLLEVAAAHQAPVLWHQGTTFVRDAPLEVSRPALLDAVARRFPELPMWIAHLGHPWCEETMATIRKHPNMYADVSALHTRPVQLYFAMVSAMEYGVLDKLLFGTDYPFGTLNETVAGLRNVNRVVYGTGFPHVPEEAIETILYRDTVSLLWPRPHADGSAQAKSVFADEVPERGNHEVRPTGRP